ncbi:MAG: hypothetical protein U9R00_00010 [Patescibacteria group bacterium]|nr:hypothetical protein [Patescibacteria group bacterium]
MEDRLETYIKEHLEMYMKYHLERGYDLLSLKKSLSRFGYSSHEIEKIAKKLNIVKSNAHRKYSKKELESDTYYYIRGILADYIKKQLNHGFELRDIRKALIKFGHPANIVDDAIAFVMSKDRLTIDHRAVLGISVAIILLFMFFMGLAVETAFTIMFVVFSPALISVVLTYFITPFLLGKKEMIPIISIIIAIVLFFFIFPALNKTDADSSVLLAINAVLAFVLSAIYSSLYVGVPDKKK